MAGMLGLRKSGETKDRRSSLRVTPDPFLVIRFPSGNYGVVFDVSDGGLGFLAYSPIVETQPIRFEISAKSAPTCEGMGRLVWNDTSGKRAGLKFTQVSEELQALIRSCSPGERSPAAFPTEPTKASQEIRAPLVSRRNPRKLALAANVLTILLACFIAVVIWYPLGQHRAKDLLVPLEGRLSRFVASTRTARGRNLLAILKRRAAKAGATTETSVEMPVASASFALTIRNDESKQASTEPTASSDSSALPSGVLAQAGGEASYTPETQFPFSPLEEPGHIQLVLARKFLQLGSDPETQAEAAHLMWQAVAKGNTTATVELAELYLSGQGVTKNCSQARVLLTAAQNRKSLLAKTKLDDLPRFGCGGSDNE
jgi:hypothetical protein